jgi:hypothetical protein
LISKSTDQLSSARAPYRDRTDIFAHIEKLATLHSRGILSEQEYVSKKAELLSRL